MSQTLTIPDTTKQAIEMYVKHHLEPGGFTTALLANDLEQAVRRADHWNSQHLSDLITYVRLTVPEELRGSYEAVKKHVKNRK